MRNVRENERQILNLDDMRRVPLLLETFCALRGYTHPAADPTLYSEILSSVSKSSGIPEGTLRNLWQQQTMLQRQYPGELREMALLSILDVCADDKFLRMLGLTRLITRDARTKMLEYSRTGNRPVPRD